MRQSAFRCWLSEGLDTAGEQVVTTLRPTDQAVGRWQLQNLAELDVRRLLNRAQQLVASDGHIEVGVDWLSREYSAIRTEELSNR